jgi:hypothetical protein
MVHMQVNPQKKTSRMYEAIGCCHCHSYHGFCTCKFYIYIVYYAVITVYSIFKIYSLLWKALNKWHSLKQLARSSIKQLA